MGSLVILLFSFPLKHLKSESRSVEETYVGNPTPVDYICQSIDMHPSPVSRLYLSTTRILKAGSPMEVPSGL